MEMNLLYGERVRLTAENPETLAQVYPCWIRDAEFWRLMTSEPPVFYSTKAEQKHIEEMLDKPQPNNFYFQIRTLQDDRFIGDVGLDGVNWAHGESFVGIALGDRETWNQGYGTDAMRVILRYAFWELNLHRVSLNTFEYNPRAIRCYEKIGFVFEGRVRKYLKREGRRWDILYMGITRAEWEQKEKENDYINT